MRKSSENQQLAAQKKELKDSRSRDDLAQEEKRKLELRNNLEVLDRLKGE